MISKLTVITGPMFSGKSSELLRMGERHILAKQQVVYIKPSLDNRYSENEIVTHAGKCVDALSIDKDTCVLDIDIVKNADVLLIDEVQFFGPKMCSAITVLLNKGKIIYVSGLDMDFKRIPFNSTMYLMGIADTVLKLTAVCEICSADAVQSLRLGDDESLVKLGEKDAYIPVCRKCYTINKDVRER